MAREPVNASVTEHTTYLSVMSQAITAGVTQSQAELLTAINKGRR